MELWIYEYIFIPRGGYTIDMETYLGYTNDDCGRVKILLLSVWQ
jgi:hypothetical protein